MEKSYWVFLYFFWLCKSCIKTLWYCLSRVLLKTLKLKFALQVVLKCHLEEAFSCTVRRSNMDPDWCHAGRKCFAVCVCVCMCNFLPLHSLSVLLHSKHTTADLAADLSDECWLSIPFSVLPSWAECVPLSFGFLMQICLTIAGSMTMRDGTRHSAKEQRNDIEFAVKSESFRVEGAFKEKVEETA